MTRMPAGLVDAGTSSLATFVVGVAATRLLTRAELGAYAIVFSAWILASQIPSQLVLTPAEARLVELPEGKRKKALLHDLWLALPAILLASVAVLATYSLIPPEVDMTVSLQLSTTAAFVVGLFPLQEHARRLLHLSRSHWAAASVSVVRLVVTVSALAIGSAAGLSPGVLPFGSIAVGDLTSLVFALLLIRPWREESPGYTGLSLMRSGKWLVMGASMGPAAGFVVSLLVSRLAGAASLGIAEAARIAAQPVLVLAVGFSAVMRPSSMEAAIRGDTSTARDISKQLLLTLGVSSLTYVGITSLPEPFNLLRSIIPEAFTLTGLMQLSVLAAFANGAVFLYRAELIALNRTRDIWYSEALSSITRTGAALPAQLFGAWAVPASFLVGGILRWVGFTRSLTRIYAQKDN